MTAVTDTSPTAREPVPEPARGPARRRLLAVGALAAGTAALFVLTIAVGSYHVPVGEVVRVLFGDDGADPRWAVIVHEVRLPRALTAVAVGAALAVAGVQMQTLFRNALADPFSLGVSSGASMGVAAVVVTTGGVAGSFTGDLAGLGRIGVIVAAALGAACVLALVLTLSRWVRSAVTLLVIGVMIGSAATALVSVALVYARPERAQQFVIWGLGSFSATTWPDLAVMLPVIGAGLLTALLTAKRLNALLLGEDYARTMGLNVRRTRDLALLGTSLLAGAATAFCGPVAFLGLAVPHLTRVALGTSDHRALIPASMLAGAFLALACALLSRPPGLDAVLPLNAITSLFGAPVVIAFLVRSRRGLQGVTP
ncbi:FecCD family ABC transporter permease [Streptomyces sp. MUM 178J]|uniref:FecCD family ABC transporter permease n=1 Tax=Streptomyces sp. MUM 178J TaxID=2791991 RepID=UPI001F04CCF1|nr:iron ABC transporter permease [Streptomyces sp. MUM 178J]WRQ82346.1 iron ABC transporter permease [Streptomyces sp. MUM 178J]